MRESILRKARESAETKLQFIEAHAERIEACAVALAERFQNGGRLLIIGNGGSACDAQHVAVEFQHPIVEKRGALAATSLAVDAAMLTAIGNDSDFSRVFAEQLDVLARPGDAVLGISTSGASSSTNRGLKRAREMQLLTVGFIGRDGGQMAPLCDYAFVVNSWSIHRVQETHTLLLHLLWDAVHLALGADDVL